MSQFDDARADIVAVAHDLAARGLVLGTAGNVSVRVGDLYAITATGAVFETITEDQVVLIDNAGQVVEGGLEPTSETDLHLGIYADNAAGAIVHTHAPAAVAAGLVADEIPCLHYQLLTLGGSIRVAPYATFGTRELADHVRTALVGRSAALMANHGAVAYGATLAAALDATALMEWACDIYLRASAVGVPRTLDAQAQAAVITAALTRGYGSTRPIDKEETL